MKPIKIKYNTPKCDDDILDTHLQRADLCLNSIRNRRPFNEKELDTIKDFFRTPLTCTSGSIEGCTFTMGETKTLLEYGITIHGKSLKETLEVYGLAEAFDYIISLANNDGVSVKDICDLHHIIYSKSEHETAGKYKTEQNFISGSNFSTIPPEKVEEEMSNLQHWIDENKGKCHPILYAAELHRKLVYIHPFSDGNGRTARLAMNLVLLQNGFLPCSISPALRLDYINSLEAGRNGCPEDFYRFIAEMVTETEKDYMRALNIALPKLPPVPDSLKESYPR